MMKIKQKLHKGEHGYINYRKKAQLLMTFFYILIGILIFIIGLLLNKFESSNIFTVIAILMVIPAAKRFVNYIVFFPFKSVDNALYQKAFSQKQEGDTFYTDVVFTSPDKIMFLSFLTIAGNQVIGLLGNEKQNETYIIEYLENGIKKRELPYKLIITKNIDEFINKYKKTERKIKKADNKTQQNDEDDLKLNKELISFLYSLIVE